MTIQQPPPTIRSVRDALDFDKQLVCWGNTTCHNQFRLAPPGSDKYEAYEKTMKDNPKAFVSSGAEVIQRMNEDPSKYVIVDQTFAYDRRKVHITRTKSFGRDSLAIGLQKDSEFKQVFDFHLSKMTENGIFNKLVIDWMEPPGSDFTEDLEIVYLGYENLIFPCLIMSAGILMSLAQVCMEKLMPPKNFASSNSAFS